MIRLLMLAVIAGLVIARIWPSPVETEGFANTIADTPVLEEEMDNALDLPWLASWSAMDSAARKGQTCTVLSREPGPANTTIEIVSASCEAGMAHTRAGDRIVIPESIPLAARPDTIRHELVHIFQRKKPDVWADFYRRSWSFELFNEPPTGIPKEYVAARRSNPDTWTKPWSCWMGRHWPVQIYKGAQSPQLRESRLMWWDSWRSQMTDTSPEGWTSFFGTQSQEEHPNELSAVLLTADDTATEAGRRLQAWWQSEGLRQGFSLAA